MSESAIIRLRRVAASLSEGDEDQRWLADNIRGAIEDGRSLEDRIVHLAEARAGRLPERRGGDRHAKARAKRDNAYLELAELFGADYSIAKVAALIISKQNRYRPAASDPQGSLERQALHRLAQTRLPALAPRTLRRKLANQKTRLGGQRLG